MIKYKYLILLILLFIILFYTHYYYLHNIDISDNNENFKNNKQKYILKKDIILKLINQNNKSN